MNYDSDKMNRLFEGILEKLDIPQGYYEKAKERYKSIGDWLHRDESEVAHLNPEVYPQGSFRLGTVIKPISNKDDYDLDLVCRVNLSRTDVSQDDLKQLIGREIKAYAKANNILKPVDEGKRCWTLEYSDGAKFHMDILPAIPEEAFFISQLVLNNVPSKQAMEAIAITANTESNYPSITSSWPRSNPRGFGMWFEDQMKQVAVDAKRYLVEQRLFASIEEVPTNAIKTPLQRAIQILKRHRDQMFEHDPDRKPISIIISTLAARAYNGETDLAGAIANILNSMADLVGYRGARIPNPVNPGEDFADRWTPELEKNFWSWLEQAKRDYAYFAGELNRNELSEAILAKFNVTASSDLLEEVGAVDSEYEPPLVNVSGRTKPWRADA